MKVFELQARLKLLGVDPDMPVVIMGFPGDWNRPGVRNRKEPTHVEVQRVCHNGHLYPYGHLYPCDAPRCESAFMAVVIW